MLKGEGGQPHPSSGHHPVPAKPGLHAGIRAVIDKHGETGRMSVHFRADESGRILPTHAEAVLDVIEEYNVSVPVANMTGQDDNNDTETTIQDEVWHCSGLRLDWPQEAA